MKRIELFKDGENRTPLSAEAINELVRLINSIGNMEVVKGTSDVPEFKAELSKSILSLPKSIFQGPGSGSANFKGAWSDTTVYAVGDVVYTEPTTGVRMIWVCEIAHGPGLGGYHTPTYPPDPSTVYWRCYSRASAPRPFLVREHYNDYLGCQVYGASYGDTARTLVAKPHTLRLSVTSQTLRGQSIVYTEQNVTEQSRLATSGGYSAVQYITEQYVLGVSVIYAAETTTTVVVDSAALTYIDLNVDARAWAEY